MTTVAEKRWLALYVLCFGVLMIVLDTTIVNVALPSIREDLRFTETSLVWVVNAYMLTFGGFLLLGGVLTTAFNWHWIFLVNLPIGFIVYALCLRLLPQGAAQVERQRLDVAGAVTITTALMLAIYAIVNGNQSGWTSTQTLVLLGVAAVLLAAFLAIEARVRAPLVPLRLFRLRNLATANVVGVLWAAAMFAWFFISALYMQLVLGYTPLQIGLAFLPANLIMAAFSLGLSARLVMRFGIRRPIAIGMLLVGIGLALFARAPLEADFTRDVLPGMLLLGLGAGMALNPLLLAAMNDVSANESGLASGVVNTSFMMGGALGLAVLASVAAARTGDLLGAGADSVAALGSGYRVAFGIGAAFALTAAGLSAVVLRASALAPVPDDAPAIKAFDQT